MKKQTEMNEQEQAAKVIDRYLKKVINSNPDRESLLVTGQIMDVFQKEAESLYTTSSDNYYENTDGDNNAVLIQEQEAFVKGCEFGYGLNTPPVTGTAEGILSSVYWKQYPASWLNFSERQRATLVKCMKIYASTQSTTIERLVKALDKLANLDEDKGTEGCTYGDTDYDSMSAAYGFNQCVSLVKQIASEALASIKKP